MINKFLGIKSRFHNNIEENWELYIIKLCERGGSDCLARKKVVEDIKACLDNNNDKAKYLNNYPEEHHG